MSLLYFILIYFSGSLSTLISVGDERGEGLPFAKYVTGGVAPLASVGGLLTPVVSPRNLHKQTIS